ncbi:hypothetical protein FACS189450_01900 [Spirochaetia bacterium]|nr:hypothetical protein FACS189450_01900 [Spirochaetia bacterium]
MNETAFYDFYQVVNRLVTRCGADILDVPRFNALLGDYCRNSYPDESRLLLLALKAGTHKKAALAASEDLCEKIAGTFSENFFLKPEAAECIVRLLWSLIRKTAFSLPKPPARPFAVVNAGVYTDWRKKRPPVCPVGKRAAKKNQLDFIHIKGITFTAGRMEPYVDPNIRQVTLAPFAIMRYPVTQLEYWELTGDNPAYTQGDCLAAEGVNWYQAVEFCILKNKKENWGTVYTIDEKSPDPNNTDPGDPFRWTVSWDTSQRGFRLPTAAEWEYASRFFEVEKNLLEWCWDKLDSGGDTSCRLSGGYIERDDVKQGETLPDPNAPKIGLMEMNGYGGGVCLNVNKNRNNLGKPCYSWAGPTGLRLVLEDQ